MRIPFQSQRFDLDLHIDIVYIYISIYRISIYRYRYIYRTWGPPRWQCASLSRGEGSRPRARRGRARPSCWSGAPSAPPAGTNRRLGVILRYQISYICISYICMHRRMFDSIRDIYIYAGFNPKGDGFLLKRSACCSSCGNEGVYIYMNIYIYINI